MTTVFLHGFATGPEIWGSRSPGTVPELSFHDLAAEAARLVEIMSTGTVLVGWSMGGMLALKIVELAPEKVKGLVLVSTTPKFLRSADWPFGLPPALLKKLTRDISRRGTAAFHDLVFRQDPAVGAKQLPLERVNSELNELDRVDLRSGLARIKVPTLIMHGTADEICLPAAAEYFHNEIKGSRLIMFPGAGHALMLEAKDKFNAALQEFLSR
jgi:pimeloyl-[acyl-carrier protein] methyl ester esterase